MARRCGHREQVYGEHSCGGKVRGLQVKSDSVQADILLALQELGGEATAAAIAKWLNKHPGNITRELKELVNKGVLVRGEKTGREVPYRIVDSTG
jgi:predicted transcriptional regulator